MKTNFKHLIVATVMFGTLSSYGLESKKTFDNSTTIEEVSYNTTDESWAVKDSEGTIIYQTSGVECERNFSKLELKDGNYTLEVEKGFEIQVTPIHVEKGITTFQKEQTTIIHKPVFRKDRNKVLVSKLATDSKTLEVTIYYEDEVIFDEVVTGGTVLGRVYKLRKDIKGDYKVVMKANDRIYINEFSL